MINIALKTEYSFKKCFGHLKDIVNNCKESALGIADEDNTFGHIQFSKLCKEKNIKPIFGVRLRVPFDDKQRTGQHYWVFIAKNNKGLQELYKLVKKAYDRFYYFPRLIFADVNVISSNIIIICPSISIDNDVQISDVDYKMITPYDTIGSEYHNNVAIQDNFYIKEEDKEIYEILAGAEKRKDSYVYKFENRVCDMHIVDETHKDFTVESILETHKIAERCKAEIPMAEMVKFKGNADINKMCQEGAEKLKIEYWKNPYLDRLAKELNLIEDKGYTDYFLIVADLMDYANKHMLCGPSRGSSAGSLVCYLLGITKIDPIKHNLIFERFIDINRHDLPDIDIDFPDNKRDMVIKYLHEKYGENNVKNLANISRLKAKSAIDLFGIGLGIPKEDCEKLKGAIIERSSGDARNDMCIQDTFIDTDVGRGFISDYPNMRLVERIENHAQHSGKHAAGIIVSNEPLSKFAGINTRDDVIMMDKKDAEAINLLKIDCLGLRTLSILEEAASLIGKHKDFYYDLELNDEKTFKIFNDGRLSGIFQFEGEALKMLTKDITVDSFSEIVAITALGRPGALRSGGAERYRKCKNGTSTPKYYGDRHEEITQGTMGVLVYQEQMMRIAKEIADFSWMEVSDMRKAASKSLGDEYFSKYKEKFIKGSMEISGLEEDVANDLWKDLEHAGSWIFNASHAVAYSMISYYTAYMKANHPLEFYAASLNHSRDEDSALRILRDGVDNDNIEYMTVDPDDSLQGWSIKDGKLLAGLTSIKGIAEKKANAIVKARKTGKYTKSMLKMLDNPKSIFDILFPTQHYWGEFFDNPAKLGLLETPTLIKDIDIPGSYTLIGKILLRNVNDLNEHNKVQKRGHKLEKDTLYLNIIIEDDYGSIMCSIGRYDYVRLGARHIAETANIGSDWFLIKGEMGSKWRGITVIEILNLTEWRKRK